MMTFETASAVTFYPRGDRRVSLRGRIRRLMDAAPTLAIERELSMVTARHEFDFHSKWAVSIDAMMRHLDELQPNAHELFLPGVDVRGS